ncbi:hypothetical protein FRC14_006391 [Serendipita sp. 396]|nr:hypothetical protein FRC14_006391 [Serendipita sp. 396]KAG8802411.1 hypothetical protein FRC16_009690 [Serendipita sp. 398]
MNEWDLAQKTNELKRRDMTIQSLQARIKELEKQLAARLDKEQSPVGQLITMKDLWSSSPLSNIDETNVSRTQLVAIAQVGGTTTDSLNSNSRCTGIPEPDSMSVPNGLKPHVSPHGSKPSVSAVDHEPGSISNRNFHKENNGTFRNLNRAPSDDPDMDDIRQFSDKIHAEPEDIVATILEEHTTAVRAPIRRAIKRNRQDVEDDEDALVTGGLGSTTGTRVMRKRNPSQSIEHTEGGNVKRTNRPIDVEGKRVIGVHGRHGGIGGLGENTSTAVARYKAAQRGKLRR